MKSFAITDVGKRRELNEDYIYTSEKMIGNLSNLFIVADGMGGHNAGDYASKHTVEKVVETVEELKNEWDIEEIIQEAIYRANAYIYEKSREDMSLRGMGTTLVVAAIKNQEVTVANIGDSRMYVVNRDITQITKDHSLVEEMVTMGGLDKEAARNHPDKNIITRAIGVKEFVLADFFEVKLEKEDKILLCTDGLTNMLKDDEIHHIIQSNEDVEAAARALIAAANENGGRDNIAVVLIEPFGGLE
ncbi:MAG: Stp1/IreP family PP2C-type Ser/Thr phosphatase [Lachnospiraceae bacterium]|nr:Stp1/IreP family PP2C-type Ser/Thr phosphatase [Lachnospiraceae bacterium]MBQ6994633.1 Stp1/IreP family PP2C-type Ser/Thr phosphatase [Lachnospiraceae bacterium]